MPDNISLVEASQPDHHETLWRIYESSFPPSERHDREGFDATLSHEDYRLLGIQKEGDATELVGLLGYWKLGDKPVIFLEHLAVDEAFRDQQIGETAVSGWLEEIAMKHPEALVVLEAEKASKADPMNQRRLNFYQRLGFSVNSEHQYTQPSYGPGLPTMPMELLSARPGATHNPPLSKEEFETARDHIHTGPYKLEQPIVD